MNDNAPEQARSERIREILEAALAPSKLEIKDLSHQHAGHAGASTGKGHFQVRIVSSRFQDLTPLNRHRLVYEALAQLMETDIHALSISALTIDEDPS